jgi:hypothetical protein
VLRTKVEDDVIVVALEGDEPQAAVELRTEVEETDDPLVRRVRLMRRVEGQPREETVIHELKRILRDATRTCLDCGVACEAGQGASRAAGLVRITRRAAAAARRGA